MGKTYKVKEGDDVREIRLRITSGRAPDSAILILKSPQTGVRLERDLEEETNGDWVYNFTDDDFVEIFAGSDKNVTYKAEMYGTYTGGAKDVNGTFPTEGTLTVNFYKRL